MASAVSLEYLLSIQGAPNGLATLDENGTIPLTQLPPSVVSGKSFKGEFDDQAALMTAYPTAELADYAFVNSTSSFWYWNPRLAIPAWVNQLVTVEEYMALGPAENDVVPYIIIP